ncbi:MAG: DUF4262 domain-containing protein [Pseudobacteriovorax sp.]|nr:DUF4262 domain-containing protein [Pseudobacteriovorax sp.]
MDKFEKKTLQDIKDTGCSIKHVLEESDLPPFSYTIGLNQSYGHPEIIVIGLKRDLAHWILNECNRLISEGSKFACNKSYDGFLDNVSVKFNLVEKRFYEEYLGWGIWLNKGLDFKVLQLLYPTTLGMFPWESDTPEFFKTWQPILNQNIDRIPY